MDYLLYKFSPVNTSLESPTEPEISGSCETFSPFGLGALVRMLRIGGVEYLKAFVLASWAVAANTVASADVRVWTFVGEDGSVLHYSVVLPTTMHLPWLPAAEAGIEIGGCFTVPHARGKRIYPYVLQNVASWAGDSIPVYMIVESGNESSRKGMSRAGLHAVYNVHRESQFARPPIYAPESRDT